LNLVLNVGLPLLAALGFKLLRLEAVEFELPVAKLITQMVVGLLLPILAGMTIRWFAPGWVEHRRGIPLRGRVRRQADGTCSALRGCAALLVDCVGRLHGAPRALPRVASARSRK
jgi:hypothetical protein